LTLNVSASFVGNFKNRSLALSTAFRREVESSGVLWTHEVKKVHSGIGFAIVQQSTSANWFARCNGWFC
jgi:hypothetical protein